MQVLISHLTRMRQGFFCAAGLDVSTGNHVRPTLGRQLSVDLLHQNGGPFAIAAVVDIGKARRVGSAPEIEDYLFSPGELRLSGFMDEENFATSLKSAVSPNLRSIFGHSLDVSGRGLAIPIGSGNASLGSIKCDELAISVDSYNKVKLSFVDRNFEPNLTVTDIRLYETDQETPNHEAVQRLRKKFRTRGAIVNVGLSRAFVKRGDTEARHWLQVNNIHLEGDYLGQWAQGG